MFNWDGTSNLLIDISRDDTAYVSGGGMYVRTGLSERTFAGRSDSGYAWPFDSMPGTVFNHIPEMKITGTGCVTTVLFDESATAWALSGLWHSTSYRKYGGTYSMAYNNESTHTYDTGTANSGDAISPSVKLGTGASLKFWSWYQTEDTGTTWDKKLVYISTDGGSTWTQIYQVSGTMGAWVHITVDLSSFAGETVKFKFRFDTVDGLYNDYEGWYIDDVVVTYSG